MPFPKVPYKPITGKLKLSIRPATVAVTVGEEPKKPTTPDVSGQLEFKLPRGFSMETSPQEQVDTQYERTLAAIERVRDKRERCSACKAATTSKMLDVSEEVLGYVVTDLSAAGTTVKIRFKQETDGALVTYYETPEKTLGIKVTASAVEVGYFMPNGVSSEDKYRITAFSAVEHSTWLANK